MPKSHSKCVSQVHQRAEYTSMPFRDACCSEGTGPGGAPRRKQPLHLEGQGSPRDRAKAEAEFARNEDIQVVSKQEGLSKRSKRRCGSSRSVKRPGAFRDSMG